MRATGAVDERWKIARLRGATICVKFFEWYIQLVAEGRTGGASEVVKVQPQGGEILQVCKLRWDGTGEEITSDGKIFHRHKFPHLRAESSRELVILAPESEHVGQVIELIRYPARDIISADP